MDLPGVSIASTEDSSLFSLVSIKKKKVNVTRCFPKAPNSRSEYRWFPQSSSPTSFTTEKRLHVNFSVPQVLVDISKGDMKAADTLVDEDDDFHLSDEDGDDADKMSLASDLDDEDLEEVERRQKELEKKAPKKK